jgi:inorganic pyrophosphatase
MTGARAEVTAPCAAVTCESAHVEPGTVVRVVVETPRGSFVKRRGDGLIGFVSPIPCPFDYGGVVGTRGADGDLCDALILGGSRRRRGETCEVRVLGCVRFVDDGVADDKLVCGHPGALDSGAMRRRIRIFFALYAFAKRLVRLGRARGPTRFLGLVCEPSAVETPRSVH